MAINSSDINFLKHKYANARNKYKPKEIKAIIVAEAPPCSLDRYFYFEDVPKQDSLFLEIMGVLYPDDKANYLASGRNPQKKELLLERFKNEGFWLIELAEIPIEVSNESYEYSVSSLLDRLNKFNTKGIPIILIKSNVFDICYSQLLDNGFNVINERMPFPGSGQQKTFREKFRRALTAL